MQTDLVHGIERAYAEHASPIVFALTGRTGSGCTTAAASLSASFGEIAALEEDFDQPERRKISIVLHDARANRIPFTGVTVSPVIFSFRLDEDLKKLDVFLLEAEIADKGSEEFSEHFRILTKRPIAVRSFDPISVAARGGRGMICPSQGTAVCNTRRVR